jgi:predicted AAA+ superfamily ATPase
MAPKAITSLKYFCENAPELAVATAGSLLGVVLSEESFPVGKVNFLSMHPMNFFEFLRAVDDRDSWSFIPPASLGAEVPLIIHEHLWELTKLYYVVGGMPEAVAVYCRHRNDLTTACKKVREVQGDLLKGYESDFTKHTGKLNTIHIHALYRNIAIQLASYHDDSTKRFRFGEVMPGKKGFAVWERPLHWLINAGIVIEVKIANLAQVPLAHFTKSNFFKLYMHDVGLLGSALGLDPASLLTQDYGLAKGYFAENFVAQELQSQAYFHETPLFSWNEGQAEIEFVRRSGAHIIPIEVKAGHRTKAKSLTQYMLKHKPPLSIKISAQELAYNQETGMLHLPLYLASWAAILRADSKLTETGPSEG